MSRFADATRNLPTDPAEALVTFAERVFGMKDDTGLDYVDAIFIVKFVERFSIKFNIPLPKVHFDDGEDKVNAYLRWINRDLKTQLTQNSISIEIDDLIEDYIDRQKESFGLAHLNETEQRNIHIQINKIREIIASSVL